MNWLDISLAVLICSAVWVFAYRKAKSKKPSQSVPEEVSSEIVWADDSNWFVYFPKTENTLPRVEIRRIINGGYVIDAVISDTPDGYDDCNVLVKPDTDLSNEEDAINEGLDFLHSCEYVPEYNHEPDSYYSCDYGEYGKNPEWLSQMKPIRTFK